MNTQKKRQSFSKKFLRSEQGNILILFAGTLFIMILIISFATDYGLAVSKRADLVEIAQLIRDARLEQSELIWNAASPGNAFDKIVKEYGKKNGLQEIQIETDFRPTVSEYERRVYEASIILKGVHHCTTLKLFGIREIPLRVQVEGYARKNSPTGVWQQGF